MRIRTVSEELHPWNLMMSSVATHECVRNTRGVCDACGRFMELRCSAPHPSRPGRCNKLLGEVIVAPYRLKCPRCGAVSSQDAASVLR